MAYHASACGSGCEWRPDPIAVIGPAGSNHEDPVVAMPAYGPDLAAPLVRVEGVRIARAGNGWSGVGLRLSRSDPSSTLFDVFLTAGGGHDLVIAVLDEDDAVAEWRNVSRATQLPLILQDPEGAMTTPFPQMGGVALGRHSIRRQHSFLRHRRPRFLARRKATSLGLERNAVEGHEISGSDRR